MPAPTTPATSAPATTRSGDPNYPFTEIGRVYDVVLDEMLRIFFQEHAEFETQHRPALVQFVHTTLDRDHFVQTISDPFRDEFERARTDVGFRHDDSFVVPLSVAVEEATVTGTVMIAKRFDVYRRKIMIPDALTRPLFTIAKDAEQEELVSWVDGEVTAKQFMSAFTAGAVATRPRLQRSDRIYGYSSPVFYWNQMAGRQGYLIVRDGHIAHVIEIPPKVVNAPAAPSAPSKPTPSAAATGRVLKTFPAGWYAAFDKTDEATKGVRPTGDPQELILLRQDGWVSLHGHRPLRHVGAFHRTAGRWETQQTYEVHRDLVSTEADGSKRWFGTWSLETQRCILSRAADGTLQFDMKPEAGSSSFVPSFVLWPLPPEEQTRADAALRDGEDPANCTKVCTCTAKVAKPAACRPFPKHDIEARNRAYDEGCWAWERPCWMPRGPEGPNPGESVYTSRYYRCWVWLDERRQRAREAKQQLPAECN